jgi:hypothetical protein
MVIFVCNWLAPSYFGLIGLDIHFSTGIARIVGLFAGYYADKFGSWPLVMLGSILMSLGFFLASFATELWQMFFTVGKSFITSFKYFAYHFIKVFSMVSALD